MKRKALLIMLLMAMVAPLAMNAQGLVSASHNNDLKAVAAIKAENLEKALTRDPGWLSYRMDSLYGFVSLGLSSYTYGVMYPSSMLTDNNTIDTVSFLQGESMTGDIVVNVYSGGDDAPANLIHTETVTTTGETGWIDLDLTADAVNFDPAQNLWITFTVTGGTGVYPLFWGYLNNANDLNDTWFNYNGSWYYLQQLNSSFAGYGWYVFTYVDYTSISCATPANLEVSDITTSTATLSWGSIGEETAYQVVYGEEGFNPNNATPIDVEARTYTLTGLTDDTDYEAYVRSNCGDGSYSAWSVAVSFYTPWLCDKPFNLETSDITYHSAKLSWDGWQDTYNVQYTPMTKTWEADFSNGIPEGWTTIDNDGDQNNWTAGNGYVYSESWKSGSGALTPDNWLVTPKIAMGGKLYITAYGMDPEYPAENFAVYYSTRGGTNISRYTKIAGDFVATDEPTIYEINLSNYSGEAYIAIRHYNVTDMFRLVVSEMFTCTAGETVTDENVTSPYTMEDLTEDTFYAVQVQGNCSEGETDWSDVCYFTSGTGNVFMTDGNWNEASNWKNNAVPAEGEDVTINANCIIPANYIAIAENVTIGDEGSLTIEDGGQLIHTNEGVVATMEKVINGYTGAKDNYYLIAPPVVNQEYAAAGYNVLFPDEVENMVNGTYDLYGFDCTADLEWINQEADPDNFVMWQGMGYLYANSAETTTLRFTGELHPFESDFANASSLLTYEASDENFTGFNLVGNMFAANGYIAIADYSSGIQGLSEDVYFYTMGDGEFVAGTGAVAPMQAVMVQASSDSQVALCYTQALRSNSALNINLSNSHGLLDAAYIRFNGSSELNKIQLNPNHTKVYFTKDNKDYAVVCSEAQGEMPVSFKAENDGNYTLSFSTENVELGYLHLIDNMTGADVDLLQTPSYSFVAKTTDYAQRFKLVFATGDADDTFAFYSNGSFVINNEGNATLQVIDINGRIVNSTSINGCSNINVNAAPGVYMLRLINGENVKVQKVVVR